MQIRINTQSRVSNNAPEDKEIKKWKKKIPQMKYSPHHRKIELLTPG
jgi:hypothetical protein